MRRTDADELFYLGAGPIAAIGLGMLLVPLREVTTASNLAFAFVALTVVIAEFGGGWATLATAVASALSLDFFLTRPYMQLAIEGKHDIIAFFGLAACGLTVASLASLRRRRLATLAASQRYHELLRAVLSKCPSPAPAGPQLEHILRAYHGSLPLVAARVRDLEGRLVASTEAGSAQRPAPESSLEPDRTEIPQSGTRIALASGRRTLGWLEVWGDGRATSPEARHALADLSHLAALVLATARRAASPAGVGEP